jgi:hypothetical protein
MKFRSLGALLLALSVGAVGGAAAMAAPTTAGAAGKAPVAPTWNTVAANQKLLSIIGNYPKVSGTTTRGITGKTITYGCVAPDTDSGVTTVYAGFCEGVQARLNQSNKSKTLPWTLKLTSSADSGTIQDTQVVDITKDVDTDHDFGMFLMSGLGPVGTNILETQDVPYFGGFTDCGKNSLFGFDISYDIENCTALESETSGKWQTYNSGILVAFTKPSKLKFSQVRYAGLAYNDGTILSYVKALESQYKSVGAKIVGNSTSLPANSTDTVDLAPYVQPLIGDKPNIIGIYSADPTLIARLMQALKNAGYTGAVSAACSADELKNPTVAAEIDGCLATSEGWGFPGFRGPGWANLTKEAKALSQPTPVSLGFLHGWFSADLAVSGLQAFAKTHKTLTSENLVNFMNQGWTYPGYSDVSAPQTFPYGKYAAPPCAAMAKENAQAKKEQPYQDLVCGTVYFSKLG